MSLRQLAVCASVIFACTLAAGLRADDDEKSESKEKTEKSEKKSERSEKSEGDKKKEQNAEEEHGGNVFTRFWIHTVGGNMGAGLKTGARKIKNAF